MGRIRRWVRGEGKTTWRDAVFSLSVSFLLGAATADFIMMTVHVFTCKCWR